MLIALVNQSTGISDPDVYDMGLLVDYQLRMHVAPAWGLLPPHMAYFTKAAGINPGSPGGLPPGSAAIAILDNADQAGDLGWHTEAAGGVVYGRVFADPVIQNGGNVLTDPLSVCSVLSHEGIETFLDSACDLWADGGNGTAYAREGCDAVESDSYTVILTAGAATVTGTVSDFLLPPWFDPTAPANAKFDWMGLTSAPFQVRSTGYTVTMTDGTVNQVFGEHYPEWRRATKQFPIARTARRLRQGTQSAHPSIARMIIADENHGS